MALVSKKLQLLLIWMVGYIHFLLWDSLRMHSKQQNSQMEFMHSLLAQCCMFEHIAQFYVDLNFIC